MVKKISEKEFEQVKAEEFALVDFSAEWCGPCQMLAPVLDGLSEEYAGKVAFYNVDVDECPELAKQFGIISIPFVVLLKKGEMVANNIGFVPKDTIKEFIDKKLR